MPKKFAYNEYCQIPMSSHHANIVSMNKHYDTSITLVAGDTHLHPDFLQRISYAADAVNAGKVILLGDYNDYWGAATGQQSAMISDMIEWHHIETTNSNRNITFLLGNHDVFYYADRSTRAFNHILHRSPGHDILAYIDTHEKYANHRDLFKIACIVNNPVAGDDYICTHAGITQGWIDKHVRELKGRDSLTACDYLRALQSMFTDGKWFDLFTQGAGRGGHDGNPSPLWADKAELEFDHVTNLNQIVGHTPVETITMTADRHHRIVYCDTMSYMSNNNPIGDSSYLVIGQPELSANASNVYTLTELSPGLNVISCDKY